jgi:hypothetical protein
MMRDLGGAGFKHLQFITVVKQNTFVNGARQVSLDRHAPRLADDIVDGEDQFSSSPRARHPQHLACAQFGFRNRQKWRWVAESARNDADALDRFSVVLVCAMVMLSTYVPPTAAILGKMGFAGRAIVQTI